MTLQTFDEKVRAATEAAMTALGLSMEMSPDTAEVLEHAISVIAANVVTDDEEDE